MTKIVVLPQENLCPEGAVIEGEVHTDSGEDVNRFVEQRHVTD